MKQPCFLVSACLLGLCTRYDGKTKQNEKCLEIARDAICIPFCPEQLGGLPTPREAADLHGGDGLDVLSGKARVLTKSGADVTMPFVTGARQVAQIATLQKIDAVILKARSPSCGVSPPMGVTAALLSQMGIPLHEL